MAWKTKKVKDGGLVIEISDSCLLFLEKPTVPRSRSSVIFGQVNKKQEEQAPWKKKQGRIRKKKEGEEEKRRKGRKKKLEETFALGNMVSILLEAKFCISS